MSNSFKTIATFAEHTAEMHLMVGHNRPTSTPPRSPRTKTSKC